jgi:hypothetical protein
MRKLIAAALIAVGALGATGSMATPGPNGTNDYGLCKAYFAGSDTGREHKHNAPPFVALEKAAGVDEDDTPEEVESKMHTFCDPKLPGGKTAEDAGSTESAAAKGGKKK